MSNNKKCTNKDLQKDMVKLYDTTKRGLDSMLFTLWEYVKWKGDGEEFKKFCDAMNKGVNPSDTKTDGKQDK